MEYVIDFGEFTEVNNKFLGINTKKESVKDEDKEVKVVDTKDTISKLINPVNKILDKFGYNIDPNEFGSLSESDLKVYLDSISDIINVIGVDNIMKILVCLKDKQYQKLNKIL